MIKVPIDDPPLKALAHGDTVMPSGLLVEISVGTNPNRIEGLRSHSYQKHFITDGTTYDTLQRFTDIWLLCGDDIVNVPP